MNFQSNQTFNWKSKTMEVGIQQTIGMVKETAQRRNGLREQRERRRRNFSRFTIITCNTGIKYGKKQLCNKLVGKTYMESELLDDLSKLVYTEIFLRNRQNREKMYTERREMDEEEAVLRDNEYYMVQRAAYREITQQKERVKTYDTARSLSQKRATLLCNDTVRKIVDLSLRTIVTYGS